MTDPHAIQKRFLWSVVLGVLVFFTLIIFGNAKETSAAIGHITFRFVPFVFGLAFLNYCIRFLRWHYYLHHSKIVLPFRQSLTVFFSGLSMAITPGKFGEAIKAYFVKTLNNAPMSRTLAVVFVERFTDFFAVVILAGLGAWSFHYGQTVIVIGGIIILAILIIMMNRRFAEYIIRRLATVRRLVPFSVKLSELYENSYQLLRLFPLLVGLLLGLLAWFSECLAFMLVLKSLHIPLSFMTGIFTYAFSTLFGAITMLPGGLATTEGSMTGLLLLRGIPKDLAAAATIAIRVATLWFAVFVGLVWFLPYRRMLAKLTFKQSPDGTL
jgi:uncharacterized protein (TIRG00374 family)